MFALTLPDFPSDAQVLEKQAITGAQFQKTAKSYYEGQKYDVTWSFANGVVSIDGEGGMQCVVDLPVEELILHQLKPGEPT